MSIGTGTDVNIGRKEDFSGPWVLRLAGAVPYCSAVSLRGRMIDQAATLPDGRDVTVHVGVPDDPYIPRRELETVDVELRMGGRVLAAVNTVLDPDQESEALELARAIARGLESGELEPTAAAIEPLADTLR